MTESFFRDQSERPAEPVPDLTENTPERPPSEPLLSEEPLSEDGRLAAIMSYIPFLCFIPLVNINWKDNEEARFHARQGIILFLIELVAAVLLIDDLSRFVFKSVLVLAAALSVVGVYFALHGKRFRLPIISDLADKAKL